MAVLDVIIIVLILLSTFLGYKKGLVSLGINLVAFVLALIISFILYRPIGNVIINTTQIDENIQKTIEKNIEQTVTNEENSKNKDNITNQIIKMAKGEMLPQATKEISYSIVYGATMVILFIILRICLMLINCIANAIAKLPILGQVNKLGGAIYGVLRGVIITYFALLIISLIIVINPQNSLGKMIEETYLTKTMMNNNILNVFFTKK